MPYIDNTGANKGSSEIEQPAFGLVDWVDEAPELAPPTLEEVQALRLAAYKAESDPLYMEWQFDETPEAHEAWLSKVTEIKARYPLPL